MLAESICEGWKKDLCLFWGGCLLINKQHLDETRTFAVSDLHGLISIYFSFQNKVEIVMNHNANKNCSYSIANAFTESGTKMGSSSLLSKCT